MMKFNSIYIPDSILPETVNFLRQQGKKGYEGRVYWIGKKEDTIIRITRADIPCQIPRRTAFGVSVTVTQQANIEVAKRLQSGEYIVAKIHSHPREAYHSKTDKENPFLRHEGAVSIVVPSFAKQGMGRLANCSVNIFSCGNWQELSQNDIQAFFCFDI
jgi:hypothetical protein